MVAMGKAFGLRIVAEGVETSAQAEASQSSDAMRRRDFYMQDRSRRMRSRRCFEPGGWPSRGRSER